MACCLISFLCEYLLLSHKFYFLHCHSRAGNEQVLFDIARTFKSRFYSFEICLKTSIFTVGILATWTAASSPSLLSWHRNLKSHRNIDTDTELETIFSWDSCVLQNISIRNIKLGESQSLWCNQLKSKSSLCTIFFHLTIAICRDENFESLQLPRIVWSLSHLLKFPFNLLLTRFWHFCM